jgi:hypothetical protein
MVELDEPAPLFPPICGEQAIRGKRAGLLRFRAIEIQHVLRFLYDFVTSGTLVCMR